MYLHKTTRKKLPGKIYYNKYDRRRSRKQRKRRHRSTIRKNLVK